MSLKLAINRNFSCNIEYIGKEKIPLLIIDDWVETPDDLIAFPEQNLSLWKSPPTLYPGIWAGVPDNYLSLLLGFLEPYALETFNVPYQPVKASSFYGIMTKDPSELTPFQKVPHVDTLYTPQLATVHYLCDESHAGTSFYRHKKTGYETITLKQWSKYRGVLEEELNQQNTPSMGYIDGDNDHFERTKECKAKFNRLLVYPSHALHCGQLLKPFVPEAGIESARLTINSFIGYYIIGP